MKLTLELKVTRPAPIGQRREEMRGKCGGDFTILCRQAGAHTNALSHYYLTICSLSLSLSLSLMLTFWVLQFRITVYSSIADIAVSGVEDVCKLTGLERAWHSSNKDGLPWVNGLGVVHDVITV